MIQRIQSVWLLLASACAFLTLRMPFYGGSTISANNMTSYKELTGLTSGFPILASTIIVGLLALIIIFLFKDRTLQLRLCVLGIVLEALLLYFYYIQIKTFTTGTASFTSILHSCIVLFFILAGRGINKDSKLIKESDRLR